MTKSARGRVDRRSVLTKVTALRTQRDLPLDSALELNRTCPTDASLEDGADQIGVHNRIGLWWDAQPNETRLSCGAERDCSQTECYNAGPRGVHRALVTTGAGSFRRRLGCAPKTAARVRPYPGVSQPAPPALTK